MAYIDRDELKPYVDVDPTDHTHDDELDAACESACLHIDKLCGWSFEASTASARTYKPSGYYRVDTDAFGTTEGLIVKVDRDADGTYEETLSSSDYFVIGRNGFPHTTIVVSGTTLPQDLYGRPTVQVTAEWGWSAVPEPVRLATLLTAARLYKRKDAPNGSFMFADAGQEIRMIWRDPDVERLLQGYRNTRAMFA